MNYRAGNWDLIASSPPNFCSAHYLPASQFMERNWPESGPVVWPRFHVGGTRGAKFYIPWPSNRIKKQKTVLVFLLGDNTSVFPLSSSLNAKISPASEVLMQKIRITQKIHSTNFMSLSTVLSSLINGSWRISMSLTYNRIWTNFKESLDILLRREEFLQCRYRVIHSLLINPNRVSTNFIEYFSFNELFVGSF